MSRKLERRLLLFLAAWQIVDGLVTILVYSPYRKNQLYSSSIVTEIQGKAVQTIADNVYVFISSFGVLLICFGLINLWMSKSVIKDRKVPFKVWGWVLFQAVFSYFVMDIIGLLFALFCGMILLFKNKALKIINE